MAICERFQDVETYLDGEAGDRADAIRRHLAGCPTCAAHGQDIGILNTGIRQAGLALRAPEHLAARLDDSLCDEEPVAPATSRRRLLALGAIAASAAVAATVYSILPSRLGNGGALPMAPDLFGDFTTQLAADRPMDFTDPDPRRVAEWFAPKLPFALPALPALEEMELRGGRLCWLLERRFAAFNLMPQAGDLTLYLGFADGLSVIDGLPLPTASQAPALQTSDGLSGAFWRDGQLAHALVGRLQVQTMADIADRLRRT